MRTRLLAVLLLALLVFSVAGFAQRGGEAGPVDERKTICWECHVSWPKLPLRSLYDVIPPQEDFLVTSDPTEFPVRIKNPWLHNNTYTVTSMDLSNAPSLAFTSAQPPVVGETMEGSVPVVANRPAGPWDTNLTFEVGDGATSLKLLLEPNADDALGPTFIMRIHPGGNTSQPPAAVLKAASPGESLTFEADETAMRELGTGNWTVVVRIEPADPNNPTQLLADTSFVLTRDIGFDVGSEPLAFRSTRDALGPQQNTLFKFTLRRVADPAPGETVTLTTNATVFYDHEDASYDDFGNVTKKTTLTVVDIEGQLHLRPPEDGPIIIDATPTVVSPARISEAIGYLSAFLLLASIWSGGIFGRASRRQLNSAFGSAKRRVAFHNFLSYGLIAAATVHLVIFLVEAAYHWTAGLIWGGIGLLAMFGLGVTGAIQVIMIKKWNYATWKWTHWSLAIMAIVFTIVHMLLDGANFTAVQNAIGYTDPLDPRL